MKNTLLSSAIILAFSSTITVQAADKGIEKCIASIQKQKTGDLIKLEKLNVDGKAVYEFELRDANGFEWEFMCEVNSGKVFETESEVSS